MVALPAQVIEAINMELNEENIGFRYNTMILVEFLKEWTDTVIKIIDWLNDKRGGGGGILTMIREFIYLSIGLSMNVEEGDTGFTYNWVFPQVKPNAST